MEIPPILIGKGAQKQSLLPRFGNWHGLITGATGTGKTVTLQVLAEGFSAIGVPVSPKSSKRPLNPPTSQANARAPARVPCAVWGRYLGAN